MVFQNNSFEDNATTLKTRKHIKEALHNRIVNTYKIDDKSLDESILKMQGFSDAGFDYIKNVEGFFLNSINSIDANANKTDSCVQRCIAEADNVLHKTIGHDLLYRQMKEDFGKAEAQRITGMLYDYSLAVNDSTKLCNVYCYAYSGTNLVLNGRDGALKCAPAKHLHSYISMLAGTIHVLSNNTLAGAVAAGTIFIDSARILLNDNYSLDKIKNDPVARKYIENMFQQFIYDVNDCSRNTYESPFTNVSVFDRPKLQGIVEDYAWYFEGFDQDYVVETILELQDIFCDLIDIGDPITKGPFTFPVCTVNLSKENGKVLDQQFLDKFCKRVVHRYNILVSKGTKLASCCFDYNQKIVVKTSNNGVYFDTIGEILTPGSKYSLNAVNAKIMHNGRWHKFRSVRVPYNKKYYKITTANKKTIYVTDDHLNPTMRGNISSKDLTIDDYLLFNTVEMQTSHENNNNYTFEDGFAIGLFLGDGSYIPSTENKYGVNYSLNKDCYDSCKEKIDLFLSKFNAISYKGCVQHNTIPLVFRSKDATEFIKSFVDGDRSYSKGLNVNVLLENSEFRKGILEGWYASDGGNANRCYTVSKRLVETMELLCTSLGMNTVIDCSDRTGTGKVVIRGEEYDRNYPLYCLRWYDKNLKNSYDNVYKKFNNSIYFKITSIEQISGTDDLAYCVEITDSDYEPYFTLPNGIITHNCRLLSDGELLQQAGSVNSFGSGLSLGSHRVCIINFPRLALLAETEDDFMLLLESYVKDAAKVLRSHKNLLIRLEKAGLQPHITDGTINMNRLFSTFGVLGTFECFKTLEEKFGVDENRDIRIMSFFNEKMKNAGLELGLIPNCEQVPGETMASRLCNSDKLIFGDKVKYDIYSNQTVPLTEHVDVVERLRRDGRINLLLTGGGIVHLTINERITEAQFKKVIERAVYYGCEHFAFNLFHSKCSNEHISEGKYDVCPICGEKIVDYGLRIIGYFRWSSGWTESRQKELKDRYIVKI